MNGSGLVSKYPAAPSQVLELRVFSSFISKSSEVYCAAVDRSVQLLRGGNTRRLQRGQALHALAFGLCAQQPRLRGGGGKGAGQTALMC